MTYEVGKGKPPKHSRFKKGQSGNPNGGRAHDQEAKKIKKLTSSELQEVMNLVIKNDLDALQAIVKDKSNSVLKVWIASIAVKGIQKGDGSALDKLLERMVGKVRQDMAFSDTEGNPLAPVQVIVGLPANGREGK
jgi:hypothetical protein